MRYVYLDNFRGFQNSLIPVLDVNFCVGENSSGKTSFLSAVNLLCSHRFWFEQNFEGNETTFKHFGDYVSVGATDKTFFRMGIAETVKVESGKGSNALLQARAYLFTYAEKDGMPRLVSCTTHFDQHDVTVYFSGQTIRYRAIKRDDSLSLEDCDKGLFREWAALQDDRTLSGTKILNDEVVLKGFMPPFYALTMALRAAATEVNKSGGKAKMAPSFPDPFFRGDAAWIAPIRTKPQRTYDEVRLAFSPEGSHMPYLIKKMLGGGEHSIKFLRSLKRFGRESGLFREVNVRKFGTADTSPFELEVVLEAAPLNISNVGYGVSQGLPVIVEALARPRGTLFAIQQPEVHLHPRAQASIGEMIFALASLEDKKFIVETHSDFTIDRFRVSLRDSKKSVPSQVLFFERQRGKNSVTPITIQSDGELGEDQPRKYREFFLKESLNVIGL